MCTPAISKLSDGVIVLTFFTPSDAPVLFEADGDAEHRRRFDFPDDFVPSLRHSENVIARWELERIASIRFAFAVRSVANGELLGGCELRPLGSGAASLSYWTYPQHRCRGVASRAATLACELTVAEFFDFRRLHRSSRILITFRRVKSQLAMDSKWSGSKTDASSMSSSFVLAARVSLDRGGVARQAVAADGAESHC